MPDSRTVLALLAVSILLLAGCSTGPAGDTPSPTSPSTATDTSAGSGPSASTLRSDALAAAEEVREYRVSMNETRVVSANVDRTIRVHAAKAVDRDARRLRVNTTQSVIGRTTRASVYLVEKTLYQHSGSLVRQYGTAWIKTDVSENFTRRWQALDTLERHEQILNASSVRRNGTETVDGVETYRLELTGDPERIEDALAELLLGRGSSFNESVYDIENASMTYWIETDGGRPVRVEGAIESRISAGGRSIELDQSFAFAYEYGASVSIELPAAAENAVTASNLTGTA